MRPLDFEGILVTNCYPQIREFLAQNAFLLKQQGMPDAASFLAEPDLNAATGQINWHTTISGSLRPISSLPPKEQILVRAKTDKYLATLRALTKSEAGQKDKTAASLLALAIQHPSDQDIYVHDLTPVLINWGFEKDRLKAAPVNAAAPQAGTSANQAGAAAAASGVTGTPVPPVPQQTVIKQTSGWTGWIPPFILLSLLVWLGLAALGVLPSPLPASLFHQDVSTEKEEARSSGLQDQAQDVYAKLQTRCQQCQQKQPSAETPAEKPAAAPEQSKEEPVQPADAIKPVPDEKEAPAEEAKPDAEEEEEEPAEKIQPGAEEEPAEEAKPAPEAKNEAPVVVPMPSFAEEPESPVVVVPAEPQAKQDPPAKEEPQKEEPAKEENKPLAQNELPDFGAPIVLPEEQKPAPSEKPKEKAKPKKKKAPAAQADATPEQTPKPDKKADRTPNKTPKGSAMQITKDAARNNDLSFLEGCWRSVTDLHSSATGELVEVEYCFQPNGSGRRRVLEHSGGICTGSVKANFAGARLDISAGKAHCSSGGYFVPQDVQCNGSGSSTNCSGKEHGGGGNFLGQIIGALFGGGSDRRWKATFIRK